jgi:hypothetical protein
VSKYERQRASDRFAGKSNVPHHPTAHSLRQTESSTSTAALDPAALAEGGIKGGGSGGGD